MAVPLFSHPQKICFGVYVVDVSAGELRKNGTRVKLEGRPFQVLTILLEEPGRVVSRDELRNRLWPKGVFVDFDHSISSAVRKLRDALNDSAATPRYIETVGRRGYRFVYPVANHPRLRPVSTEEPKEMSDAGATSLGASAVVQGVPGVRQRRFRPSSGSFAAGVMLIAAAAIVTFLLVQRTTTLSGKNSLVLVTFNNNTGDPQLDGALKEALAAGLQQSPFLNIVSDQKVRETLRMMGRSPDDQLDQATACDLCQRVSGEAVLSGSITSLGTHYAIALQATNCTTGDSLDREEVEAASKEEVLNALDKASTRLRKNLGESIASIAKFHTPLAQVTTPSLEALKAFSAAVAIRAEQGDAAAIPLLKQAIELDPKFAMAHALLANANFNLQQPSLTADSMQTAFRLRNQASEWEKFYIQSHYYHYATGELEKAIQAYELWAQTYPRAAPPLVNLETIYGELGRYDRALAAALEAVRRDPDNQNAYTNLMAAYTDMGRLDDAKATYQLALARKLNPTYAHFARYAIASLEDDAAEMARQVAWAKDKPGLEDRMLAEQADREAFYGRLREASSLSRRAVTIAEHAGEKETAALWQMNAALRQAEFGNRHEARKEVAAALALSSTRDVQTLGAFVMARAGALRQSKKMAEGLALQFRLNTLIREYWLPTIYAAIELQRHNPVKAVEILQTAAPYELGETPTVPEWAAPLHPVYIRAEALLLMREGESAALEYNKFVNHRSLVMNCTPGAALAILGLARVHAVRHDTARARAAYQEFLSLWKGADNDIPILQQAKLEYVNLR